MSRDIHVLTGSAGLAAIHAAVRKELDGQSKIFLDVIHEEDLKLLTVMVQEKIISSDEHDNLKNLLFSSDTEASKMAEHMIRLKANQLPSNKLPKKKESPEQKIPESGGIWQQMNKAPVIKYNNNIDMTSLQEAARYIMSKDELEKADELLKHNYITAEECEKIKAMILSPDQEVSDIGKKMLENKSGGVFNLIRKKL